MTRDDVPRRPVSRLVSGLAAVAVALTPGAATLMAAPGEVPTVPPVGVEAWRADPRHLPDPVTMDPAAVRRFFDTLGADEQRALAAAHPGVVGNLDGAPLWLRYEANRRLMARAGEPYRSQEGRFLLFDLRGQGTVAQVYGDLASARRIAVLVPGAGNRAGNFWRGVAGKALRSPALQGLGIAEEARRYGPAADGFAVVVWLGYDAPDGIDASAARADLARAGAAALERFVAGLVAVRPQATLALLGYSYGSTVIGLAAHRLPGAVTDIAAFGSPGMGVDDAAGLRTTARVWAGLSAHDVMRFVPGVRLHGLGHGRQPADPAFGATRFATGDVVDHDHYLALGTDSQASLTRIALFGTDRQEEA
ncbi:alpha/beta hydrolase [Dactylosporangium fulvum]|uniref:Alpha/beta hydrolase family protein n=1 Tax=Dactylosporangium fulvum TaxID=53359 RepID=A0ABY5VQG5_9ACTN|nr:alpha/beta hydrolase family protein [Dactylosporangium fulvum]UWP79530.1 alpha/beta hydrolase family protein [Dactylosporangium fulvum]